MIRLSFIVPFYGVEQYIEKCIRSLYAQDIPMEEYEVICVDDCCQDGSRAIVERLHQEYPTLRLICHERNKKIGGARNTGLALANGQYVWFVDSDDELYPNTLKTLLAIAEENRLDILQFDYARGKSENISSVQVSAILDGETYLFQENTGKWVGKVSGAWRQLFLRKFLLTGGLKYIEDAMYEDTDYLLNAFLVASRVQYIDLCAYYYRCNSNSITQVRPSPIKLAWMVNQMLRCAKLIPCAKTDIAKLRIAEMVRMTFSSLRQYVKTFDFQERKVYIRNLSTLNIMEYRLYTNWRTYLAIRYGITMFI